MNVLKMTDLDLSGKRVLIREDLNVPVKGGKVTSDARIRACLPTIQAALDLVSRGRTTLVIAHRLSTVISADEIIVLQDGRIAERGHHVELLAARGLYAAMWDRQREANEAEEKLRRAREEDDMGIVVRRRTAEVEEVELEE